MTDQMVFSGNLRFISLTNVFKLLGENNCTGILSLRSDYTEFIGLIYFVNGNAINGSFGDLKGLKAVYSMFGWTEGNYEFLERELSHINPVIKQSSQEIIIQAFKMLTGGEIKRIGPLKPEQMTTKKEDPENEYFILIDDPSEQAPAATLDDPIDTETTTADEVAPAQMDVKEDLVEHELFHMMDESPEQAPDTIPDDHVDTETAMAEEGAPAQIDVKEELVEHELFHMIDEPPEQASDTIPDDPMDAEMIVADIIPSAQAEANDEDIEKEFLKLFSSPLEIDGEIPMDDPAVAEQATPVPTEPVQMEISDEETEREFINTIKEPLETANVSSPLEPMVAETAKDALIISEPKTKNNKAETVSFDLSMDDSLFEHNSSFNRPTISDAPISPGHAKTNNMAASSGSSDPIEEPLERSCSRCGTPLGINGAEESLFDHNVCFRCDTISDGAEDAEITIADPLAPKVKKIKKEEVKKTPPVPVKEPMKPDSAAIPRNSIGAEIRRTSTSASKVKKMKKEEVKKTPPVPITASSKPVPAKISDDLMDNAPMAGKAMIENGFNLMSTLKSKLQSWGPFHYFVTISIVLAWVVVGIIYFGDSKPPSPKAELPIAEKNTPKTETSSQEKPALAAVTQAPAANDAASLQTQDATTDHVKKTIQTNEAKPLAIVNNAAPLKTKEATSGHQAIPQEKENRSTPEPVEKTQEAPKQIVPQQANPVEKDNAAKITQKEVVEPQVPVAETEVAKIPETKGVIESHDTAEKIKAASETPPAKEAAEKEPAVKPAIVTKDPEFPGGKAALAKWLSSHITIPQSVTRLGVEGNVIVELTIDSQDGKISNVAIVKSLQKQCDQEVIRVVSNMPNWKPGEVNGVKATSKYNLSVRFSAQ
jgi:outer membrane biosynthesis protein TonB